MRFAKTILVILFSMLGALTTARATTQIHIDLSSQTMHVDVFERELHLAGLHRPLGV